MNSQYLDLAKKLKALAEQGFGGEKYAAQLKLDTIMKKYGIRMEDLEDVTQKNILFKVTAEQESLFVAVVFSITGSKRSWGKLQGRKDMVVGSVTRLEEAEIRAKFGFFWSVWSEQVSLYQKAFILKNDLLPTDMGVVKESDIDPKELEKIRQIFKVSESIERSLYYKPMERGVKNKK